MPDNHEMMDLDEHKTDTEIMSTIRYLDPDLTAEKDGAVVGISVTLLTALTGALASISRYIRDF